MNTFQLACFVAVADTLSFARAAEQLNVTQPAITHQIRTLETELGVKLFRRSTRSVSLTHEGATFLSDAGHMLAIAARAKKRFGDPSGDELRVLSIGCHSFSQLFLLSDVLREMSQRFSNIHPRMFSAPFQYLSSMLDNGDIDIVLAFRSTEHKIRSTEFTELAEVPVVCAFPVGSPLSGRGPLSLSDLDGMKIILSDPLRVPERMRSVQRELTASRPLGDIHFSGSPEGTAILAAAGYGVGILPQLLLPPDPQLDCARLLDAEPLSFGFYCRHADDEPLKTFIRLIRRNFSPLAG